MALALGVVSLLASASAVAGLRGRHLVDVLAELRARGLPLVYSTAVVRPDLVLSIEPRAQDARSLLDEVLAPFGLTARADPTGALLVVRAEPVRGKPEELPPPTLVEEIVVTPGHHELVPHDVTARRSLSGTDVTLAPTLGSDASRAVGLLPGIAASDTSAAFYPRGATSNAVATILDGLELYGVFHLDAFQRPFTVVDGRMVEAVDFTGGGFTADRGDRNGGFVEMSTAATAEGPAAQIEVGTLNSRFAYETPSSLGPVLISARYWYPEAATDTIAFGSDGLRPSLRDVYVKAGLRSTAQTLLTGHLLLASDDATLEDPEAAERLQASSASGTGWVRLLHSWSDRVSMETVVSAGELHEERGGVADPDEGPIALEDDRRLRFAGLRADAAWTMGYSDRLRGGVEARVLRADLRYASGPPGALSPLQVDPSGTSYAAYLAYRRAFLPGLTGEAGMRWDRQSYTGEHQWSPRLHVVWQPAPRDELRVGVGRYAQSQRIHELRIEDGETSYRPAEQSDQIDLTYTHGFRAGASVRLDGYLHGLSQVIPRYENLHKPVELFPEVEPDRVRVAPDTARLTGVEVSVSGDPKVAIGWSASYVWSKAVDVTDGVEVPRSWDQTHAGKFLLSWRSSHGWFAAVNGTVHTGWPTTPMVAQVVADENGTTTVEAVPGARNAARLPTYARLDLRAGREMRLRGGRVRVELSVLNATDRANACCLDEARVVGEPGGPLGTETTYDSWLGVTPALQVLWTF